MIQRFLRIAALWLALGSSGLASQATWVTPGAPLPMTSLASFLNAGFQAVGTFNIGSSSPTVGPSGAPIAGMAWWNNSANPWKLEYYDGTQWVGGITLDATNHLIGAAFTNTVTVNAPSGTLAQGLVVNQTLPTCGVGCPQTTQLNANIFTVVNPGWYVDDGSNVNLDSWGLSPMDAGVRVNYSAQGGVGYTIHTGLAVAAINGGTSNQLIGTLSAATAQVNTSGVDTLWGIIGTGDAGPSANVSGVRAIEAELGIHQSATVAQRTAFSAASFGGGQGSSIDAVLWVYQVGPVATGYGAGAPFKNLILLDNSGPNPAISTTGTLIGSRGGSSTIANLIELPSYTITGDIINVPGLHVTGAGAGVATGPDFPSDVWNFTTASGGSAALYASTNQNPGFDGIQASDSQGKANLSIGVWEASDAGTLFGQTRGLFTGAIQFFANAAGELVGTTISAPLILGTNNANRAEILGDGCFDVGLTSDCGAPGIVNVLTGFRIGNAASSGHVLRGNGSNYVDATLGTSDLSTSINALVLGNGSTLGAYGGCGSVSHEWIAALSGSGGCTQTQPAMGDISDYGLPSWTPSITTDGTPGTPAYSAQVGSVEEIGRQVIVRFFIALSGWTGSPTGNVQINLPVAAANVASDYGICGLANWSTSTSFASMGGYVAPNTSLANIRAAAAGGGTTTGLVTAAQAGSTPTFFGTCVYRRS